MNIFLRNELSNKRVLTYFMNKKENKDTLCNGSLFTLKRNFTMLYLQPFFYKGPEIFSGASRSEFATYEFVNDTARSIQLSIHTIQKEENKTVYSCRRHNKRPESHSCL